MKIGAFTKSFQDWSIPEVCHRFRDLGLDGLDLTVRSGGHIEPENVKSELPLAAKAALEAGTEILMLTTKIVDPTPEAETLLATAAELGITKIKMGYYKYGDFGTLREQLDEIRRRMAAVAKMAKPFGVLPCVHIHAGKSLPSHGTQLYHLIHDFAPDEIGAYADTLHMALEGGEDGWRQGLDMLAPWLALVSVKNYVWQPGDRDKYGQRLWRHVNVPVADGISPIPQFVETLKQIGFDGTYSLHSEYKGKGSFKDMDTDECYEQTRADLDFFRKLF